jgi:N-acyl-D-amino-acid deacylase
MRNEDEGLVEAVEEAIRIGREADIQVQISHHKVCGRKSWGKVKDSLAMLDDARRDGLNIWADQYPYIATCTGLGLMLPKWAHDGGTSALLARLRDVNQRRRIREELLEETSDGLIADGGGWESVVINSVRREKNRFCEGLSIKEIAARMEKEPVDAVLCLLEEEEGGVGMMHFVISEADVATVMKHPAVVIGSDATARARTGAISRGKPHPRAYGTFARVLGKYVRDEGTLTLEEAVAKMTGRSAKCLSLSGRGVLAEGYFADITVFDPDVIEDTATFENSHSLAKGVRYVLVNGQVVLEDGVLAGTEEFAPGRVLRRGVD